MREAKWSRTSTNRLAGNFGCELTMVIETSPRGGELELRCQNRKKKRNRKIIFSLRILVFRVDKLLETFSGWNSSAAQFHKVCVTKTD